MSTLLLLGAGGHAKVVAETALATKRFCRIAFLDDCFSPKGSPSSLLGFPIIGPLSKSLDPFFARQWCDAIVALGDPSVRLEWLSLLTKSGYNLPSISHPSAWVSPSAKLGAGSVVFAQAVLQSQANVGIGSILNTGCSVDHDSQLADGVHICPGARLAGGVSVGLRSWIGIGASVIQQICIGDDVTVGAGAAVLRDLPNGVTAVGIPARVLPTA